MGKRYRKMQRKANGKIKEVRAKHIQGISDFSVKQTITGQVKRWAEKS